MLGESEDCICKGEACLCWSSFEASTIVQTREYFKRKINLPVKIQCSLNNCRRCCYMGDVFRVGMCRIVDTHEFIGARFYVVT